MTSRFGTARAFDSARVRGLYPTLGMGTTYLDGPLCPLQPESVIRAVIATLRASPSQPGAGSVRSRRSAHSVEQARIAIADLVSGNPESVLFGTSLPAAQQPFVEVITAGWGPGDEIVLSRLDSDALLSPWLRAARSAGAAVRWAEVDLETGELPTWQYDDLVGPRTRLVTVSLANAATGTVPDVAAIAALARTQGAIVVVDAGAAVVHRRLDLAALGTDLLTLSTVSFGGPTVTALIARPDFLLELDGRLNTPAPHHFELAPLPVELLDGVTAAVDHLAGLLESARGSRRARLAESIDAAGAYCAELWQRLDAGLRELPDVVVLGAAAEAEREPADRVPVLAFAVAGRRPAHVGEALAARGVSVWTGPSGLGELLSAFGADELGGAVFAGLMPHTTAAEVDQLLAALRVS